MLNIIIPVFNEEKILTEKREYYSKLKDIAKLIFVDGGSKDRTPGIAEQYGEVIFSERGRSSQMNAGAKHSEADALLFLHVDTYVAFESVEHINRLLSNGSIAGCLSMKIEDRRFVFRIFERLVNFRAKYFGVVDGDLGLFIKRGIFDQLQGFDDIPIMEDIEFSKKLRKLGKIDYIPETISVSSREWHNKGFLKTLRKYTFAYIRSWTHNLQIHPAK